MSKPESTPFRYEVHAESGQWWVFDRTKLIAGPFATKRLAQLVINCAVRDAASKAGVKAATNKELVAALEEAEACMSIVEPRSDKAEYFRILGVVRAALMKARAKAAGSISANLAPGTYTDAVTGRQYEVPKKG